MVFYSQNQGFSEPLILAGTSLLLWPTPQKNYFMIQRRMECQPSLNHAKINSWTENSNKSLKLSTV